MDPLTATIVTILTIVIVFIAAMLAIRGKTNNQISLLTERLTQISEYQATSLNQLSQKFQEQERALTKSIDERLSATSIRVSETLEKNINIQKTSLDDLKERLVRIDTAQKNITELSSQMISLQDLLSNKQARGAFGEVQLHDLVSSILPPNSYTFQATLSNNKRADCLLNLPMPPGPIVIDAKFPLESYRALQNSENEQYNKQAKRAFSSDILKHITDIAEKYILPGETAEAALMFLPSEAVYAELHANFSNIVEKSYQAKVFIVSPTTLWATLNTVRAVLKDVHMKEAAGLIQKEIMSLITDVSRLDKRVGNLQRHFDQASEDMREVRISAEKINKRSELIQNLEVDEDVDKSDDIMNSKQKPELREIK